METREGWVMLSLYPWFLSSLFGTEASEQAKGKVGWEGLGHLRLHPAWPDPDPRPGPSSMPPLSCPRWVSMQT